MARSERVTVTLPSEVVADIERFEGDRSRLTAEATIELAALEQGLRLFLGLDG